MLRTRWSVAENLARVHASVAEAAVKAGRRPEDITIVAVSKTQPAEAVIEAIAAGLHHFGENRVQEAAAKIPEVLRLTAQQADVDHVGEVNQQRPAFRGDTGSVREPAAASPATRPGVDGRGDVAALASGIRWHLVGHLQSNKAGAAVDLFDTIDSVDSLHLAQALSRRVLAAGGPELAIRLEVYVGDDPRRPGLRPDQLIDVAGQILELPGLRVEGLMTVAPLDGDARVAFGQVRELKVKLSESLPSVHFGVLSMGMSEDFAIAIQEGSTEIRPGTALFGPRQPR
jgi:PLP dependent protein